jgi:predicted glycoside hydrolase/deacetylase ChbG (UPF0249 family)
MYKMIKRMILNSDDFGITEGVTIGTIHAHVDGVLTSTTCMMNMPYAEFALNLSKDYPDLGVGIHLVFTAGRPLVDGAKSFTDEFGNFRKLGTYTKLLNEGYFTDPDPDELYTEWKAQIEKFIALAKKLPTHIDSHHHAHLFPNHQEISIRLAKEYNIPIRQSKQIIDHYEYVRCDSAFYGDHLTNDDLINMMKNNDDETLEIMCHPGYLDQRLMEISAYQIPRVTEMAILRSEEVKQFVKDNNIELINYSHLNKN